MKKSKIYRFGKKLMYYTFIFCLLYTVIYQFIDGFHYKPISEFEKILDVISSFSFDIGALCILYPMLSYVDNLLEHYYDNYLDE